MDERSVLVVLFSAGFTFTANTPDNATEMYKHGSRAPQIDSTSFSGFFSEVISELVLMLYGSIC